MKNDEMLRKVMISSLSKVRKEKGKGKKEKHYYLLKF